MKCPGYGANRDTRSTVIAGTVDHGTGENARTISGQMDHDRTDGPVTVHRCYVPATYGKSYLGRMWAFFGFTLSASTAALLASGRDVVIGTSPPLMAVIPAWIAARWRFRRVPWIFEMRDLWPESAVTTGVIGAPFAADEDPLRAGEVGMPASDEDQRADARVRGRPGEALAWRRGEKIVFVPNGADIDNFVPGPRDNARAASSAGARGLSRCTRARTAGRMRWGS